jgi:hypothetical protein
MAIINKGANGPFRGKAGSIIGSGWKKVDYIKGMPRRYKNKGNPSEAQRLHHKKFALLNNFLIPISSLLDIGFGNFLGKSTSRNAAFQYNYDQAFMLDENGELSLDYSHIQLSRGSLFAAGAEKAELINNQVKLTWNTKTYGISGELDDEVHAVAYIPSTGYFLSDECVPLRYQGETFINGAQEGETIHLWLFFADKQHKKISPTVYLSLLNDHP